MKNRINIKSAIIAGISATIVMTLFTLMAPLMGIKMNIPAMLASTMGLPIIFGWLAHFMIGTSFGLIYVLLFLPLTKKVNSIKSGLLFSLIPWIMLQIAIMPMMSEMNGMGFIEGLFSGSVAIAIASLTAHLIYGIVLSKLYNFRNDKVLIQKPAMR